MTLGIPAGIAAAVLLGLAAPAVAKSITVKGLTFSDEAGGVALLEASGSGSPADPFVLVEEISGPGPAILTIRGLSTAFGNRASSHHTAGFALTKIVHNRTDDTWAFFDLELREFLGTYSPYEDGLSFGQGSGSGRPFRSDSFRHTAEIDEPFDSVSFTGGLVPPGGTLVVTVVVTDTTPRPAFYLLQKRQRPFASAPPSRRQIVENKDIFGDNFLKARQSGQARGG